MPTASKKKKTQKKTKLHTSFRLTRRRDAVRPLELPGYFSFTNEVTKLVWKYKRVFGLLVLTYIAIYIVLVGMQSQSDYATISDTLKQSSGDLLSGFFGTIGQAGILLVTLTSTSLNTEANQVQQVFTILIVLLTWLTTVWLLRNLLAGHKVKLRDGLYNSAAPLISTAFVALLIAVQLIPVSLAAIAYSAATSTGLLAGGVASMLFWVAAALLTVLSLYWITSSLFAMVIVTLPGMYPYRAIKTAGEIVQGRRIKILLRWVWMAIVAIAATVVIMIPIILLMMGLTSLLPWLSNVSVVPVVLVGVVGIVTVWCATYIYLLYRKVVDYATK